MASLEATPADYYRSDAYYRDLNGDTHVPDSTSSEREYTGPMSARQFGDYMVEINNSYND